MSHEEAVARSSPYDGAAPSMPGSAWALAWSCLVGQLLILGDRGPNGSDGLWLLLSVLLSALLVGWVSAGVLTARTGRMMVAWVVFGLSVFGYSIAVIDTLPSGEAGWPLTHLATSVLQVAALWRFSASDYFAARRSAPRAKEPDLGSLMVIAVLVGVLGGATASAPGGEAVQVKVGL